VPTVFINMRGVVGGARGGVVAGSFVVCIAVAVEPAAWVNSTLSSKTLHFLQLLEEYKSTSIDRILAAAEEVLLGTCLGPSELEAIRGVAQIRAENVNPTSVVAQLPVGDSWWMWFTNEGVAVAKSIARPDVTKDAQTRQEPPQVWQQPQVYQEPQDSGSPEGTTEWEAARVQQSLAAELPISFEERLHLYSVTQFVHFASEPPQDSTLT